MIQYAIAVGLAYWLLKGADRKAPEPEPSPDPEPSPRPDPSETKWTETAVWSGESVFSGSGGENVVWIVQFGIRYQDGSTEMSDSEYILIGNKNHTAFLTANSDRGTLDIKKEYTGGDRDIKNAVVFPDLASAEARADELSNPPARDPNDPVQPQPEPEPPEDDGRDDGFGGLPSRGGYQLGQGSGTFTM